MGSSELARLNAALLRRASLLTHAPPRTPSRTPPHPRPHPHPRLRLRPHTRTLPPLQPREAYEAASKVSTHSAARTKLPHHVDVEEMVLARAVWSARRRPARRLVVDRGLA